MTETRFRARSVSEIVDAAFQLYREDALQYIVVTAVAYAPWLILRLLFVPGVGLTPSAPTFGPTAVVTLVLSGLGTWVSFALMTAVIVRLGSDAYLGDPGPRDVGATMRELMPRIPAILIGGLYKYVLAMLGLLCLVFGALYVAARYFAVDAAIVLEGRGAWAALGRSSVLSKGRKRHILNTLILIWLIYFVLDIGVTLVGQMTGSTVILLVLATAFTIVAYPLIGLTEMLLYYDARIRGEGFDIELMARSLESGAAEA
ncbi:MAG: hypothetical protein WBQ26_13520 [Gemmatimonadaceae bacterium]|nr:hypothetical protein [Gemmatimonadaceae bacterium]